MNRNDELILFWPEYADLAHAVSHRTNIPSRPLEYRTFPDGECFIRIPPEAKHQHIWLLGSLYPANERILALRLAVDTLLRIGAERIVLITPYLPYMRQDKAFSQGEAISTDIIPEIIQKGLDSLVTVDPHLHRIHDLKEIYRCPARVIHSADLLGEWIFENIPDAVVIGPDSESKQWVAALAARIRRSYIVLKKERRGDFDVSISDEGLEAIGKGTPVLVDDIISSGTTMIRAAALIREKTGKMPAAAAVHGIFAGDAYEKMKDAGFSQIITTNSIIHPTNKIDLTPLIADFLHAEKISKAD